MYPCIPISVNFFRNISLVLDYKFPRVYKSLTLFLFERFYATVYTDFIFAHIYIYKFIYKEKKKDMDFFQWAYLYMYLVKCSIIFFLLLQRLLLYPMK